MKLMKFNKEFPEGFLFGGSTSAIQFEGGMNEGGRGKSVIDNFKFTNNITDFSMGSDHYHHYKEDIRLAYEANLKSYRFSISWTRILPNGNGEVNQEGIEFYNNIINELVHYGIEPIVTIYHFDYPQHLVDEYGGWTNRKSIDDFADYCRILFETYGDRVKYWLTINEQDHVIRIPSRMGLTGKEVNYDQLRYQANHHMCVASAKAFKLCHELCPQSKIGPALSYQPIYPASSKSEDVLAANDMEMLYMNYMCELQCKGVYPIRLWKYLTDRNIEPEIMDGDMECMKENTPDYLGINYYCSGCAGYAPVTDEHPLGRIEGDIMPKVEYGIFRTIKNENLELTKFGWAIDPVGITYALINLYERYNLPLMITENGLSYPDELIHDTVEDDYRIDYIASHLKAINEAINIGVEVLGYNLWSFIDLISGHQGFNKRYGLVYVNRDDFDLKDMKRYKKKSFEWYRQTISERGKNLYNEKID